MASDDCDFSDRPYAEVMADFKASWDGWRAGDVETTRLLKVMDSLQSEHVAHELEGLRVEMASLEGARHGTTLDIFEPVAAGAGGLAAGIAAQWLLDVRLGNCFPVTGLPGLIVAGIAARSEQPMSASRRASIVGAGVMFTLGSQVYGWMTPAEDSE